MRLIPAGTFQMGSDRNSDEKPVHQVTIAQPFWLGDSEVTLGLWQVVMGNDPRKGGAIANLPVVEVSWDDCQGFFQKLHGKEQGLRAGFPTEAQREYACRAGMKGDYAGDPNAMAWYNENNGGKIAPVKRKQANAWGLYDMHGGVWEWCADGYADSYAAGSQRNLSIGLVYRGGSRSNGAWYCRSAVRDWSAPVYRSTDLGFRFAAQATP
jgi:formylglycine-generating enzyme required for sulfatase activity